MCSMKEAMSNIKDAIGGYVESLRARGAAVPVGLTADG
jgi:predicted RNase H-like HicB family nuclease